MGILRVIKQSHSKLLSLYRLKKKERTGACSGCVCVQLNHCGTKGERLRLGSAVLFSVHREEGMNLFRIGDTPDSVASPPSGYSYLGSSNHHISTQFKIPDKLQIVKPLEGMFTL